MSSEALIQKEHESSSAPSVSPEDAPATVQEEDSFAEMLAQHEREEAPQSRLTPGQRVTVRIVAITADTIFVSTGSKVDGIVDREEMEVDGQLSHQVGDMLDLYVVTANSQEVKLSRILRGAGVVGAGCFVTGLILIGLTGAAGRLLARFRRPR